MFLKKKTMKVIYHILNIIFYIYYWNIYIIILEAFQKAIDEMGGLDLVINNAGILDDGRWELSIDINVVRN